MKKKSKTLEEREKINILIRVAKILGVLMVAILIIFIEISLYNISGNTPVREKIDYSQYDNVTVPSYVVISLCRRSLSESENLTVEVDNGNKSFVFKEEYKKQTIDKKSELYISPTDMYKVLYNETDGKIRLECSKE